MKQNDMERMKYVHTTSLSSSFCPIISITSSVALGGRLSCKQGERDLIIIIIIII